MYKCRHLKSYISAPACSGGWKNTEKAPTYIVATVYSNVHENVHPWTFSCHGQGGGASPTSFLLSVTNFISAPWLGQGRTEGACKYVVLTMNCTTHTLNTANSAHIHHHEVEGTVHVGAQTSHSYVMYNFWKKCEVLQFYHHI